MRWNDTAPSYGASEDRLGRFLSHLAVGPRCNLQVATKFGEHWQAGVAPVDHSYDSLCRSVDRSLRLLGRIDLLQIHKCTSAVLATPDLRRAVEYARNLGVRSIGASVSDTAACEIAARTEFIDAIQLPLNARRQEFPAPARAAILRDSFSFLARQGAADIVLTGTRCASHLRDNHEAFRLAAADADPSL